VDYQVSRYDLLNPKVCGTILVAIRASKSRLQSNTYPVFSMHQTSFNSLIPPQPEILVQLNKQCKLAHPELGVIAALIKNDVAIYAAILKSINSPYYGLAVRITSIEHAINLLGFERVLNLIRLIIMHNTLKKTGRMERFWDTARDVSKLSVSLAESLCLGINTDDQQALGMLHDCGLPLMIQAFKDYRDFLRDHPGCNSNTLEQAELTRFGLSHYQVGARMTERWYLPAHIAESIRLQPQRLDVLTDRIDADERSRHLLAILTLAQDISTEYRYYWRISSTEHVEAVKAAQAFLGILEYDYLNIKEGLIETMAQDE